MSACQRQAVTEPTDVMEVNTEEKETPTQESADTEQYTGTILAGTTSKVLDFNQNDYDAVLASDKTILLYYYANWCPICKREVLEMYAAFSELDDGNVVAFRVNYKDSDTDDYEEELAREYGVSYQHTKVILKNGEQVLKSPDSWDKERYLEEISRLS